MDQKIRHKVLSFGEKYKSQIVSELILLFIIFNLLGETPYLNIFINNIFVRLFLLWLTLIFIFKINFRQQMMAVFVGILTIPVTYYIGSVNYETTGNLIFLLIVIAVLSYMKK